MRLSVVDVEGRQFRRRLSGYAIGEVEEFRRQTADSLEELCLENATLKQEIESLRRRVEGYQEMEKSLSQSLILARQAADELKTTAHREAGVILKSAEAEAQELLRRGRQERMELEWSGASLREEQQRFFEEFRALLQSYLSRAEARLSSPGSERRAARPEASGGDAASPKSPSALESSPADPHAAPPQWLLAGIGELVSADQTAATEPLSFACRESLRLGQSPSRDSGLDRRSRTQEAGVPAAELPQGAEPDGGNGVSETPISSEEA